MPYVANSHNNTPNAAQKYKHNVQAWYNKQRKAYNDSQ